ncbi:extracellular solute-binding protein [Sulfitobacter pseudonitzschiae]|uniref:Putrescine-binding periplasmic protein n=1 Tax=Pseudosulfitobacter pseudonitzschiae TaxID=1402135 RepID=A0A9Q2NY10_9RHOB|nr:MULTISPECIES: extracellular solute-binding protein [Roseobacteraceae]MBM2290913.1 extracellular solute-binding protein [Pseudosulfitobacter pseudonitzschiae]MBM2295831.1 extracellular solute-binding protein [Pseudosulfitobacter pseudonitzschiae]MBM2300744.1 extracellular solute-binding protein [Pseudosulfitobacter pseudonitzschiae]MBM2310528.1 extracellular solute-binding protein [Pseudosulfitobacter pseudonitzschiae]MBM2315441.1 extracellular solute-binding protein [Pseudosulfitobacter pse
MKKTLTSIAALMAISSPAFADGALNIYNWGNYTSPEMIEKFEAETGIKVTVTDYDSNDTALAKIKAGGHGFDIVVPSGTYVPIFIQEGLLMESKPNEMENFKNMDPQWVDVEFDPGRNYTVPWQWGTVGVTVNTAVYGGDINTAAVVFDPPEELKGKINVVPEMNDVMGMAIHYVGGEQCTDDKETLMKVRDVLKAAKPFWVSMDYGNIEKFAKGDLAAGVNWNGASFRSRVDNADIAFGYPQEGYPVWMDNAAILADAQNVDNAKIFLNFIMDPENAAMLSSFARYANGIAGSEEFLPEDMKTAPEIVVPEELKGAAYVAKTCPPSASKLYTAIWTDLLK